MTLFLSDLHLGRGPAERSRAAEIDAVDMLRSFEKRLSDEGGSLVLVGDVFDHYMEYKHLTPKGFVRLMGLLADWTDRGISVTYIVGNRDPWHIDYFEKELGVRIATKPVIGDAEGYLFYAAHGDGLVPSERFYNLIRPLLRSRAVARLYRMGMPGDAAFSVARWVARTFSSDGLPSEPAVIALEEYARNVLSQPDVDLVVLGHCHRATCKRLAGGFYMNPGYWFADRTFGYLDADGPTLYRWSGGRAETFAADDGTDLLSISR